MGEASVNLSAQERDFEVGQMAVHPAHGVGRVDQIETRDLGGTPSAVYVLRIEGSGLKVMVPRDMASRVGLRPVMSEDEAEEIADVLQAPEVAVTIQPWNRRFRAYTEMVKSGRPTDVARVLRDMARLRFDKDLSFGERRLLDQARALLVEELAIARGVDTETIDSEIESILSV